MNALVKPAALRPGATLAVLSPASTPKPELVERGLKHMQTLGYRTVLSPHALDSGPLYYAGRFEDRLADLHAAFADPAIDGIVCTRGGWGSAELLPYLNAELIRANPKAFIGYSDHTSLHSWLENEANLISFYGPMVAADFSREDGVDMTSWRHTFEGDGAWSLGAADGLRVLRAGVAEGRLRGGCISIYAEALGTPYAPQVGKNTILFLEDIGTKPYQWDRLLLHLRYAGRLEGVRGIVFGDMRQCVTTEEQEYLEGAILHALRDFDGPVAIGLRSGHVDKGNITLPLGVSVRLDLSIGENSRMQFIEAAVTV
ncbi:muramoyltetrapeptide carboxypeptidase [Edaphobacter aggregans]|uniref:Muramoyltetrapeptide carboxypeptidase n=1 Tax=Edaphobacter aggregans TaxID=570835 RepID=A0A3R9Q9Y5_9BACT|nr:LD-carboxypeptidase [Edaphobacter aggregans]RSL16153.1 muramoyltetrapeptide carboxypeptidase [Edaphobacter aggregans]